MLAEDGATLTAKQVGVYRRRAGVISFFNKVRATREQELKEFIAAENKLEPWSDVKLAELLQEAGIQISVKKVRELRYQLASPLHSSGCLGRHVMTRYAKKFNSWWKTNLLSLHLPRVTSWHGYKTQVLP